MSIGHLLDHEARIWRRVEELDEYRSTTVSYEVVENQEEVPCASDGQSSVLANLGPGMAPTGFRWIYFDVGPTLEERWLIEFVSGPTAPAWLEIESVDPFRGHHIEVRAVEFNGKRPEAGS